MSFPCVICSDQVRTRQHALECDSCFRWQHRLCDTGITLAEYRAWGNRQFICNLCKNAEPELAEEATEDSFNIEVFIFYSYLFLPKDKLSKCA